MNNLFIKRAKECITYNDLSGLKKLYNRYQQHKLTNEYVNDEYVYKSIVIHAALRNCVAIVQWLLGFYHTLEPIVQIALRPTLVYCKYITTNVECKRIFNDLVKSR